MPKNKNSSNKNDRIVIRGVRRKRPDTSKIARAVIGLALREAALEAEAQGAIARADEPATHDSITNVETAGEPRA